MDRVRVDAASLGDRKGEQLEADDVDHGMDRGDEGRLAAELAQGLGTGVRFQPDTPRALAGAIERAAAVFRDPSALERVRRAAMARDSSWLAAAQQYVQVYRSL